MALAEFVGPTLQFVGLALLIVDVLLVDACSWLTHELPNAPTQLELLGG